LADEEGIDFVGVVAHGKRIVERYGGIFVRVAVWWLLFTLSSAR